MPSLIKSLVQVFLPENIVQNGRIN